MMSLSHSGVQVNGQSHLPNDYAARLDTFRQADADRNVWFQDLLHDYEELKVQNAEIQNDLKNEIASRRMWQTKATVNELALKQVTNSKTFVLGVIDGDGALFQDAFITKGKDGGAEAAQMLHDEIQHHLQSLYPDANISDWSIVVHVVLNLQGLASKLMACGIINNPNELAAFGRAFGLAKPLFSFIDVGGGKERADHKLREMLRLYAPISQCKHIFFAPCHDNGYLPVLEPYKWDPSVKPRLTLIETQPAEPGFVELGLRRIRMPALFRNQQLPNKYANAEYIASVPPPIIRTSTTESNPQSPGPASKQPVSPTPSKSLPSAPTKSAWATVGRNGVVLSNNPTNKNIDISPARQKPSSLRYFDTNAYDERLDFILPKSDRLAEASFERRTRENGKKSCNNYHLLGRCDYPCGYAHGDRMTPGEILVMKHKARSIRCSRGLACRDIDCFLGHVCKFGDACNSASSCPFSLTHKIDSTPAVRVYEDGSKELLSTYSNGVKAGN